MNRLQYLGSTKYKTLHLHVDRDKYNSTMTALKNKAFVIFGLPYSQSMKRFCSVKNAEKYVNKEFFKEKKCLK